MILFDGRTIADKITASLKPHGSLHLILIGDDPASLKYVSLKQKKCDDIGQLCGLHHFSSTTPESEVITLINSLNQDTESTGILVQLPLPPQLNRDKILTSISPAKDVDGLTPGSPFVPAVVRGIIRLLKEYSLLPSIKTAVIINDSDLIGKPLQKILSAQNISVTLCNDRTADIKTISQTADLLVSATGVKNLVTSGFVKPGAVVIDAANGDVDFATVSQVAGYLTPTYNCIGPLTIACLLENLLKS